MTISPKSSSSRVDPNKEKYIRMVLQVLGLNFAQTKIQDFGLYLSNIVSHKCQSIKLLNCSKILINKC